MKYLKLCFQVAYLTNANKLLCFGSQISLKLVIGNYFDKNR